MKVPSTFPLCFNSSCPRRTTCLHYEAGQNIPSRVTSGCAIYPTALTIDGTCPYYRENVKVKLAYGFNTLYANVKKKDISQIRERLIAYVGNRTSYYRFNSGEKYLSPLQQEYILNIFKEYGYTDSLQFDHYLETYDFTD